jgi:prephenate dehydratase
VIGKPSEYSIHIDVEWKDREDYENAMKKMLREVHNLSVLGEYKKAKIKF